MRNGLIDYFRLIAAFGIVWFHSHAVGHELSYLALPFFLTLLGLPSRAGLAERARRLLLPFALWSGIYVLFAVASAWHGHKPLFGWANPWMLLGGTAPHLWFLPFALLIRVLAGIVQPKTWLLPVLPPLAALAITAADRSWPGTFAQWQFALVPALLGLAFFADRRGGWLSLLVSAALLIGLRNSPDDRTIILGTALAFGVASLTIAPNAVSGWCARISMNVYLSHVLFMLLGLMAGLSQLPLALVSILAATLFAAAMDWVSRSRISLPLLRLA